MGGFTQVVWGAYFNIYGIYTGEVPSVWEESTKLGYIGWEHSLPPPPPPRHGHQLPTHLPPTMGKPVFFICQGTLPLIMFGGIFGFDIERKFNFN